jgi:hypothetical protein
MIKKSNKESTDSKYVLSIEDGVQTCTSRDEGNTIIKKFSKELGRSYVHFSYEVCSPGDD